MVEWRLKLIRCYCFIVIVFFELIGIIIMANMELDVLLKKGKRSVATYVQAECARSATARPENLHNVLDMLLDPLKTIDDWEVVDWCKSLMAGGTTFDEFASTGEDDIRGCRKGLLYIDIYV